MSYPAHLESDVVLRDGSTVALRPVEPSDEQLLHEFFGSLDERSLSFRFFTGAPNLMAVARTLAAVDQRGRFGLLALRGPARRPVGHGFYAAMDDERAEVAFAVSPELQGHGLGTILLAQLSERTAEVGFTTFVADVLPHNHRMVSSDSGLPVKVRSEPEAIVVEMPTSRRPEAIARFQEHDTIAARAAVAAVLDPTAMAVVDEPGPDLPAWIAELAGAGVRAVVVRGELSASRADELLAACRAAGTRLVGPASLGILDSRTDPPLDLTASGPPPPAGRVGIVAQGAAGSRRLLSAAARREVGVSTFVSLGDRADVSANDLLEYWEEDPPTRVAVLQVESFSDPRRFARVARRVGARKPIVVLAEETVDEPPGRGLFDQVGAIRVDSVDGALNVASALAELTGAIGRRPRSSSRPTPGPTRRRRCSPRRSARRRRSSTGMPAPSCSTVTGSSSTRGCCRRRERSRYGSASTPTRPSARFCAAARRAGATASARRAAARSTRTTPPASSTRGACPPWRCCRRPPSPPRRGPSRRWRPSPAPTPRSSAWRSIRCCSGLMAARW
jgi:succinyl-CoA synthetase alpha subunit